MIYCGKEAHCHDVRIKCQCNRNRFMGQRYSSTFPLSLSVPSTIHRVSVIVYWCLGKSSLAQHKFRCSPHLPSTITFTHTLHNLLPCSGNIQATNFHFISPSLHWYHRTEKGIGVEIKTAFWTVLSDDHTHHIAPDWLNSLRSCPKLCEGVVMDVKKEKKEKQAEKGQVSSVQFSSAQTGIVPHGWMSVR